MTIDKIEKPHPDYEAINAHSANSIILMGGSIAMRDNKELTIPQNQYESDVNYQARVKRSVLLNTYKTTLDNLSNKPFQEPVKWSGDLPKELEFIVDNIDGSGMSQDAFFKTNVTDSLQFGKHMYLVNMPSLVKKDGELVSEVERVELNLNPFASRIQPNSLISWFYEDDKTLGMIKIQYQVEEIQEGEVVAVNKIDLWTRQNIETYAQRVSTDSKTSGWILESTVTNGLGKVTLVIGNDLYDLPTLENLSELNMLHFSKSSDKDNNIHMAMTPFLQFKGYDPENTEAVVAVYNAYVNPNTSSDINWVEITGAGVTIAIEDLKNLEGKMSSYGNDIITAKVKTATEVKKDDNDEMSTLQAIVVDVENSAAIMLSLMAEWLSIPDPELTLEIFKDFNSTDQALEELKLLQKDYFNDAITLETYLKELVIRKIIKAKDFDVETETQKIEDLKMLNFDVEISETTEETNEN